MTKKFSDVPVAVNLLIGRNKERRTERALAAQYKDKSRVSLGSLAPDIYHFLVSEIWRCGVVLHPIVASVREELEYTR